MVADAYRERESHDRSSIDLPPVQKQLAAEVIALGKPTVSSIHATSFAGCLCPSLIAAVR